jgi:hypothetical protein
MTILYHPVYESTTLRPFSVTIWAQVEHHTTAPVNHVLVTLPHGRLETLGEDDRRRMRLAHHEFLHRRSAHGRSG